MSDDHRNMLGKTIVQEFSYPMDKNRIYFCIFLILHILLMHDIYYILFLFSKMAKEEQNLKVLLSSMSISVHKNQSVFEWQNISHFIFGLIFTH